VTTEPQRDPGSPVNFLTPDTHFEIQVISRHVTLDRVVGIIDDAAAKAIAAAHDEIFSLGTRPHTFHDWSLVIGYSPFARKFLTSWLSDSRGKLRSAHILFSSRVLAMGIAVANAVLGGFIVSYADPETFGAALERATHED